MKPPPHETARRKERVFLAACRRIDESETAVELDMEELAMLAEGAGGEIAGASVFPLRAAHPKTYLGRGQAERLAAEAAAAEADEIIFDDELSPAQANSLAAACGMRVLDRTQLILDIFAARARTREGRLQVEMAILSYLRPRLKGMWTHLERQKGGIGLKGPGEKQIELDRRRLDGRLAVLRERMAAVRDRRERTGEARRRKGFALATLVGYTNAGKSTLLNRLAAAEVYADDRLFATLDPTTRLIDIAPGRKCLLTDTVGFIRKLPHHLVEAFKATLEEVETSDLLLHVVDLSHPAAQAQCDAVEEVLRELGAGEKPRIVVLNKCDRAAEGPEKRAMLSRYPEAVCVSAKTGEGMDRLASAMRTALAGRGETVRLRLPAGDGKAIAAVYATGQVVKARTYGGWLHLWALLPPELLPRFAAFRADS
ncbi:MAG: GTPase HflX [Kiritimatiellae bacterium]|nr:GTPase HflX [Kiritimatiellia bacterium]